MAVFPADGGGRGIVQEMMFEGMATILRHDTRRPHAAVHSTRELPAGVEVEALTAVGWVVACVADAQTVFTGE